jgi:hypothetical protein
MLSSLLSILVLFYVWDYILAVPTDVNEFVMTQEYIQIFGGPNATNTDLRTCLRGDLVQGWTKFSFKKTKNEKRTFRQNFIYEKRNEIAYFWRKNEKRNF